jgi:hypothetical protein
LNLCKTQRPRCKFSVFNGKPKYFSKEKPGRSGSWFYGPRPTSAYGRPRQGRGGGLAGAQDRQCSGARLLAVATRVGEARQGGPHRGKNQLEPWRRQAGSNGQRRRPVMPEDTRFGACRSKAGAGNQCGEAQGRSWSYL